MKIAQSSVRVIKATISVWSSDQLTVLQALELGLWGSEVTVIRILALTIKVEFCGRSYENCTCNYLGPLHVRASGARGVGAVQH